MSLFGPVQPIEEISHLWRAVVAFTSILVGTIMLFFLHSVRLPEQLQEMSVVLGTVATEDIAHAGGDIFIAPPVITPPALPMLDGVLPDSDKFTAKAIIVKDVATRTVLFRKNEYEMRSIASLTKLMSALLILERHPDWMQKAIVIKDDIADTHMYAGDTYTLEELWNAALIGSSNKAIYTLADAVGWPREAFVERMNEKARELGMMQTVFVEPTGLDAANVSTASDLAILLAEAVRQPEIYEALQTKEYTLFSEERQNKHHLWNTNWLLLGWIPNTFANLIGGKTGYIPESGYNFVMRVGDEFRHELDVIILGAESHEARFTEASDIAEAVWKSYKWP